MSDYYQALERDLLQIMGDVGGLFEPAAAQEVQMYLDAGEFGLALETICAVLNRKQTAVSAATYVNISDVGKLVGVDPDCWLDLVVS